MARMLGKIDRPMWDDEREHATKGKTAERRSRRRAERQEWRREYSAMVILAELNG